MTNPFVVYVVSFGSVLFLYSLGWSDTFPPLTLELLIFLIFTFIVSLILAPFASRLSGNFDYKPGRLHLILGPIFLVTLVGEIFLNGIPLLRVINGERFYKIEANATHLHMFVVWSFYSVLCFSNFVYTKRFVYLILASGPVIAYAIFVYRGPAIIVLLAWMFVYLIKLNGLRFRHIISIAVLVSIVLFLNGVMGDIRSPGEIEASGKPSKSFIESGIPRTYFWAYFYATHPIGNLQNAINVISEPASDSLSEFIVTEFVPTALTMRILPLISSDYESRLKPFISRDQLYSWDMPLIAEGINLSTIYGRSYGYLGWFGPIIMYFVLTMFIFAYIFLIRRSPYRVPCLALLNTLVLFVIFTNMLVSSVIIPLLAFPLVVSVIKWFFRQTTLSPRQNSCHRSM